MLIKVYRGFTLGGFRPPAGVKMLFRPLGLVSQGTHPDTAGRLITPPLPLPQELADSLILTTCVDVVLKMLCKLQHLLSLGLIAVVHG